MIALRPIVKALVLAFALPSAAIAQTAPKCVTTTEAQNIVMFALPEVMRSTIGRCRPHLPASAYLLKSGEALAVSYQVAADAAWPKAKPALLKAINQPMIRNMPDSFGKPFLGSAIGSLAADRVQPGDCETINRAMEALAPLPPQNMATLIGLAIEKQGAKAVASSKKSPFEFCPSPTTSVATK
jgi:hypothetical protein